MAAQAVKAKEGIMLIAFDVFLYYGEETVYTVNAAPAETLEDAKRYADELSNRLGSNGYAIYDPQDGSSGHFPGPCLRVPYTSGQFDLWSVFRPTAIHEAGRRVIHNSGKFVG